MKNNIIKLGLVVILGSAALGLLRYGETNNPPGGDNAASDINLSISIDNIYEKKPITVLSGLSVLEILEMLDEGDSDLNLELKEYSGLGVLVQGMVGMTNGEGNRYWQYEVNGVMPQVGASQYVLEEGDFIKWTFERSEF